jgi:hypothetical protein
MPSNLVKTHRDEELWSKAKARAAEQGHKGDWAYINGIYQRMKGHKKTASLLNAIQKEARVLNTRGRKRVAKKNFAMPASAAKSGKGQKGSYPIHDIQHARSALSYGSRHLSSEEYAKLKKRVYAKYPSLKKTSALKTPLLDEIPKCAASKLMWGLGGLGVGAFGFPWFKNKFMGVRPETRQLLEQGNPNFMPPQPTMINPYLNRPDLQR